MQLKDIIKITIFAVIGLILSIAGGYASMLFGPAMLYINSSIAAILTAPVFFVMAKKVHKRGAIFLYFLIPGIVYTMMGFWPMLCILTVGGILAELIVGKEENYLSDSKLTLSYMIGELVSALHGIIFFLVLSKEGVLKTFPKMFTPEQADTYAAFYGEAWHILAIIAIQLFISFIGAKFGSYIYNKFFGKVKTQSVLK